MDAKDISSARLLWTISFRPFSPLANRIEKIYGVTRDDFIKYACNGSDLGLRLQEPDGQSHNWFTPFSPAQFFLNEKFVEATGKLTVTDEQQRFYPSPRIVRCIDFVFDRLVSKFILTGEDMTPLVER